MGRIIIIARIAEYGNGAPRPQLHTEIKKEFYGNSISMLVFNKKNI